MSGHLNAELSREIRDTAGRLPPYPRNPQAVDYSDASVVYAINATLLYGNMRTDHDSGIDLPTAQTRALVVRRASGDGVLGSASGVSGYVDILHDPDLTDEAFDPIASTIRRELREECGIPPDAIRSIGFYLGTALRGIEGIDIALGPRFEEPKFGGEGIAVILPALGICRGADPPPITLNLDELSSSDWVPLGEIADLPNPSPGYLEYTLPNALATRGLRAEAIQRLLRPT